MDSAEIYNTGGGGGGRRHHGSDLGEWLCVMKLVWALWSLSWNVPEGPIGALAWLQSWDVDLGGVSVGAVVESTDGVSSPGSMCCRVRQ